MSSTIPKTVLAAMALHLVCMTVSWFIPPALNSDSATGFLVWDSLQRGAPWNHIIAPDQAEIGQDTTYFQAWWAPGQYLIVAPWQSLGLSLGHAIAVGGFLTTAIGLWGYWRLFLAWGFDAATSGWAVLAAACNWTLTRTYGDYLGGEPALLAALPWLVLAARGALRKRALPWLALPVIYWLGSMAKLSFPPLAAGLVAGLRGPTLRESPVFSAAGVREIARWIGWLGLGYFLVWATYLRLGPNPASAHWGKDQGLWWDALLQLPGFPISSSFSLGSLASRIFMYPSHPLVGDLAALWPLHLLFAVGGLALEIWVLRREFRSHSEWTWVVGAVIAAYTGFFVLMLVTASATGMEDRYFKPVGFLLLPGLVEAARSCRRGAGWALRGALIASSVYGVAAFVNRAAVLRRLDNVGRRGFTQQVISRRALAVLHDLDGSLPDRALLALPSPEMALEPRRVRVLSTHAVMTSPADLESRHYRGRVADLIVLVNAQMLGNGQARSFLGEFENYPPDDWRVHRYGEWFFYHQGTFAAWPPSSP